MQKLACRANHSDFLFNFNYLNYNVNKRIRFFFLSLSYLTETDSKLAMGPDAAASIVALKFIRSGA